MKRYTSMEYGTVAITQQSDMNLVYHNLNTKFVEVAAIDRAV